MHKAPKQESIICRKKAYISTTYIVTFQAFEKNL